MSTIELYPAATKVSTFPDSESPIAISIVSGSGLIREALASALTRDGTITLAGTYSLAAPTVRDITSGSIFLLDGGLPCEAALEWARSCRVVNPMAQMMVIELVDNLDLVLAFLHAGVRAYTLRGASVTELLAGLRALQQSGAYCSPTFTCRLLEHIAASGHQEAAPAPAPAPAGLTTREIEVLRFLVDECSNQEIAKRLVIEVRTVKHHVHNILQKLNVRHRWEAARLANRQPWLDQG
jgi:two-component system nitrate/nitrite response regulator NarL